MQPNSMARFFLVATFVCATLLSYSFTRAQTSFKRPITVLANYEKTGSTNVYKDKFDVEMFIEPDSSDEKFILNIINPTMAKIRVRVQGLATQLYSYETNEPIYRKRFNMAKAVDGVYVVTVFDGKKNQRKEIILTTITTVETGRKIVVH